MKPKELQLMLRKQHAEAFKNHMVFNERHVKREDTLMALHNYQVGTISEDDMLSICHANGYTEVDV